jgi:UDP-glucose 4-epimerase
MASLKNTRVLVTGAPGFIGAHLTRRLVAEGAEVHALSPSVSSVYPRSLLDVRHEISMHEANIVDRSAMDSIAKDVQPEVIFHLGAYTHVGKSWQRIDECIQTNVQGTINVIKACAAFGFKRFINMGTSEIYGDIDVPFTETDSVHPNSPYSVTKYAAERLCRLMYESLALPIVLCRPFNAFGPGQTPDRIIPETIVRALQGEPIKMTSGRQTREFNYVEDIADGLVRAAVTPDIEGELFNIGCGQEVAIKDIARITLELMGDPVPLELDAIPHRPTEIWRMYCDNTRAREILKWEPKHTLEQGLEKTIAWYRSEIASSGSSFALS